MAWLVRDHSVETIGTFAGLIARRREKPDGVLPGGFAGIGAPILAAIDPGSAGQQRLRGGLRALLRLHVGQRKTTVPSDPQMSLAQD